MRLKELRTAKGITQSKLSETSGVSQSFISEVEAGLKKPGLEFLLLISKALECSLDDLVGHEVAENGGDLI